jgi:hypothetical protein
MSLDSASIFPLVHVNVVWCYETQCMNVDNLQLLIAINGTHAHRCLNSRRHQLRQVLVNTIWD